MQEQILSLAALVILLVLACVVFAVAGVEGFSVVTCVGVGLFSTWRTRR
jgi:preprotein translocase subunit SecF